MKNAFVAEEQKRSAVLRRNDEKEKRLKVSTEKEKEKTKLRERHRRSITTQILTGLRKHGNYNLPPRADINDVLRALATEAGWIVEADGTTYRNPHPVCSGPSHSRLLEYVPVNCSSSNPGSLTATSLTNVPSGGSLNSLGEFGYVLPPLNLDATDCTAGECSTTSSPRHINNTNLNLLQSGRAPFVANEEPPHLQLSSTLPCLGGLSSHYVLGTDPTLFTLKEDVSAGDVGFSTDIPAQSLADVSNPVSSSLLLESATLNSLQRNLYPTQLGSFQSKPRTSLPTVLLYPQQYPMFPQESRASNQNTPIGSPQPYRGSF